MGRAAEFFMPMEPPTATAQERQVAVRDGRPVFYEPERLRAARRKLTAHLAAHAPGAPFEGALELVAKWCFPCGDPGMDGAYRLGRPDTDNLDKLLKDCMTRAGFWHDDAQVCREIIEKFWAATPGIYVRVTEMG